MLLWSSGFIARKRAEGFITFCLKCWELLCISLFYIYMFGIGGYSYKWIFWSNGTNIIQVTKFLFEFLEDVSFKSSQVKSVLSGNFDRSHMGNINVEGYFIWDLQKYVEEFILKQLVKRGLSIEEKTVKITRLESEE